MIKLDALKTGFHLSAEEAFCLTYGTIFASVFWSKLLALAGADPTTQSYHLLFFCEKTFFGFLSLIIKFLLYIAGGTILNIFSGATTLKITHQRVCFLTFHCNDKVLRARLINELVYFFHQPLVIIQPTVCMDECLRNHHIIVI